MAPNKTQVTNVDPAAFIASVEHPVRRADAERLLAMMSRVSGCTAQMWGPSIVGFGRYHYKYDSGREGDFLMTGFSPRKANMVLYVMPGYADMSAHLSKLGKHKLGKSCLYVNKLADVDFGVLEAIIADGVADVRERYETWGD